MNADPTMSTTETINFTRGVPANESFPIAEIAAAAERALQKHGAAMLQYGPAAGLSPLCASGWPVAAVPV